MKRIWAVLLSAALLASCRSAQPTTNPFMRTTVAPPATTPGVIVTPGQPYAQGISPPMITSPAPPPVNVAPIAPQQVAPVMPAPVAAPMAAPPVMQNGAKFHPPGGDYLFHQSSHEPRPANAEADAVQLAAATQPQPDAAPGATQPYTVVHCGYAPPSNKPLVVPMQADGTIINPYVKQKPTTMQADGTVLNPYVQPKLAAPPTLPLAAPRKLAPATRQAPTSAARKSRPPATVSAPRLTFATPSDQPPANPSPISVGNAPQASTLRIVGESSAAPLASTRPPSNHKPPALRITAGGAQPSIRATVPSEGPRAGTNLAVNAAGAQQNSASLVTPEVEPAVVRASFQPAANGPTPGSDYSHTPDYQKLRGKLEYSASLRQWKLRYIPIDGRTDAYGGSVILPDATALAGFKPGDLVEVRGALPAARISSGGFAPQYAPTSIERLAR